MRTHALLGIFIAISLLVSEAKGYQFTEDFNSGFYWQSLPVGFEKFAADSSDGNLLASLTAQAEQAWENAVGTSLWSSSNGFVQKSGGSGNHIRWSFDFGNETGFDPSSTLAITIRYRSGTYLTRFEIILNGNNSALRANVNNMLYQTILHELGHVLGLDHSSFSNAVMAANLSGANNLHFDDVAGMNAVVDETLHRQATGFVSPLSTQNDNGSKNALACGTVDLDQNGPGGGKGFMLSLFLGLVMMSVFQRKAANFS